MFDCWYQHSVTIADSLFRSILDRKQTSIAIKLATRDCAFRSHIVLTESFALMRSQTLQMEFIKRKVLPSLKLLFLFACCRIMSQEFPSDITIQVGEATFNLHKVNNTPTSTYESQRFHIIVFHACSWDHRQYRKLGF